MSDSALAHQQSRWARNAPWVITVIAIVFGGWGWAKFTILGIQASFAAEQTSIFERARSDSRPFDRSTTCDALDYVVGYYPSGTKQVTGSFLDQVVERHRQAVMRELIARLRNSSSDDFGDDPQDWIDAYCRGRSRGVGD